MSILQVATGFSNWGGTELHILNLSDQLLRRGHDVTVACRPGCWVEDRAKSMNLPTVPIRVMKQFDWQDYHLIREFLRENHTDVVHVHWSSDMIVPAFAGLREKVPVRILSRHMPYPFKNRFGRMLYSRLFTKMVTVSHSVKDTLIRCGVAASMVEVIHHGTDVEAFASTTRSIADARKDLSIPENCLAVGIVGRIAPEKGHKVLLEAARLLGDRYPIRYVIIGDGPDEAEIRRKVAECGLSDFVSFAGFREDVNNAMLALDIVAVPSVWNEPCSAVVQQAMALSKPVIGTSTGGTPEMIQDEHTGVLIPPSDPQALADAIALLAGDAFRRKAWGKAGRSLVDSQFSLRVMTDKIEDLYHREYTKVHQNRTARKVYASQRIR